MQSLFEDDDSAPDRSAANDGEPPEEPVILASYKPPSTAESVRRIGLAWSAGIAFGGAIIFMAFLGWLVDLLAGISPWGIVGGIIFGSIIGFLQFFRITSQIFGKPRSIPAEHPLMSPPVQTLENRDRFDEP